MRKLFLLILTVVLFITYFLIACNSNSDANTEKANLDEDLMAEGFNLLESNCFSCHSPNAGMDSRVAPPMFAVKKHYVSSNTSLQDLETAMWKFISNPSAANAKMPGAIDKFGVMPKMGFNEEQIKAIAYYIYNAELEKPDWFDKHYEEEHGKYKQNQKPLSYLEQGKKFAMQTKGVLGKNLLGAINEKGTVGALEFCNVKAYPLTDSMAVIMGANIKRVSDKNRNPENAANELELAYITTAKNAIAETGEAKPEIMEFDDKVVGYYPITTNTMCLQCHGKANEEIAAETMQKIQALYPDDKAVGNGENELRGIWVVEMKK